MVAHYVRDVGVGRSSRLFPTSRSIDNLFIDRLFFIYWHTAGVLQNAPTPFNENISVKLFTFTEIFFTIRQIIFTICLKKFITNFVTAVTNFLTHVTNFVTRVTKFVTKNIL